MEFFSCFEIVKYNKKILFLLEIKTNYLITICRPVRSYGWQTRKSYTRYLRNLNAVWLDQTDFGCRFSALERAGLQYVRKL